MAISSFKQHDSSLPFYSSKLLQRSIQNNRHLSAFSFVGTNKITRRYSINTLARQKVSVLKDHFSINFAEILASSHRCLELMVLQHWRATAGETLAHHPYFTLWISARRPYH